MDKLKETEGDILKSVRQYLRLEGFFVIRNQQSLGSHLGLSDLTAVRDDATLWIEIKKPKGYQSDRQKEFEHDINSHGGKYIVVRSVADIQGYLLANKMNKINQLF